MEINKINEDILNITKRIDNTDRVLNDQKPTSPQSLEEDILKEINDRENRSTNIILFNLEESVSGSLTDTDFAKDIIRIIQPEKVHNFKLLRLGNRKQDLMRPLRISLPSKQDVHEILRNKSCYSGPVRIAQDLKQRNHLKDLQSQVKALREEGILNKIIRYRNSVPRIVDSNQIIKQKTNSILFSTIKMCMTRERN